MTRVAVLQFASGTETGENLVTCLRMIDEAAQCCPDVMVLPEFCNHISWYDDAEHARAVSLELEGSFLEAIAGRARRHNCYLVINVTLRRKDELSVTSLMYSPAGVLLAEADKQTLMGHENFWFQRAQQHSDVVTTPVGKLAMFPCRDGVTFETPRGLALRGAQLFCDSLNSFALDEASLHVPVRAPENRCFLAAANKVGPLIPAVLLESVSAETHIPVEFLYGAGESQIVSPDGTVLARAPRGEEAVVWADLDLEMADDNRRADGTDIFASRRPALYAPIASEPQQADTGNAVEDVTVACLLPQNSGPAALEELPALVGQLPQGTRLAVLPELFAQAWLSSPRSATATDTVLQAMVQACTERPELALCASVVRDSGAGKQLCTVLVDGTGPLAEQAQLHATSRFPGLQTGATLQTVQLPWARVALLTADDLRYPEVAKLAAIAGAQVLAVPGSLLEDWELPLALPSRSAENRLCLVYSARPLGDRAGLIADLHPDFTLMSEWQSREFDGYINQPLVTPQQTDQMLTAASINPRAAQNKLMSAQTDLILDRPWRLSGELVRAVP